jgi:uncharacterized membrane protein YjdF
VGALRQTARRHPALGAVTLAYLVGFAVFGAATGAPLTVPYAVVVAAGLVGVAVADDRARFSAGVLVGLCVWGAAHMAGGLVDLGGGRILYNATAAPWLRYDNAVHFVGFGVAGVACWEALVRHVAVDGLGRRATAALVCTFAMGLGAANEVVEFGASHLLDATNVGGYQNTGRDLVANLLGGLVAGVWVANRGFAGRPAG